MTHTTEPVTLADLGYLRRPHAGDPWVPALELELAEPVETEVLRDAVAGVLTIHPRLGARPQRGRWVPGTPSTVPVVEAGIEHLRSLLVDTWFAPNDPGSFRVGRTPDGRRLLLAWRHAATDAAGGVGAALTLTAALADAPLLAAASGHTARGLWLRSWTQAARPDAVAAFAAKARGFGGDHAEFPITGQLLGPSDTVTATLDAPTLREAAARGGAAFTGGLAAALAGACFDLLPDTGEPVTMLLPVNLRPADSRWAPAGNFVGNAELRFDAPPSPAEASAQVAAASGPDRYSAMLAAFARAVLPGRVTASGEDPDGRLRRTVVLNNLGHLAADDMPGVASGAFLGPTAVDFPSVSFFSVGDTATVCVRARVHQGGADLARRLLAALFARLGVGQTGDSAKTSS